MTHLIPRNPSQTIVRARMDDSTSNLSRHVMKCEGPTTCSSHAINDFAHGSSYSKAEFRFLLVSWVTGCHRPFAIVDDHPLQDMFRMLYAKVDIPSAAMVSRDTKDVHIIAKKNVIKVLQVLYHTNIFNLYMLTPPTHFSNIKARFILALMVGARQMYYRYWGWSLTTYIWGKCSLSYSISSST
jgi:hypothetical protein